MARQKKPTEDFLVAGAKVYPQGKAAIAKFEEKVSAAFLRALAKHRVELTKSIDPSLGKKPKRKVGSQSPDEWSLGFEWSHGNILFEVYVFWWYDDDEDRSLESNVVASVSCKRVVIDGLWAAFQRTGLAANVVKDRGELFISDSIAPANFPHLEARVGVLLTEWAKVWKKAGGLKKYLID